MKLAHRILAAVLACAMPLTFFTACGTVTDADIERVIKEKGYITREEALALINSNSNVTYVTNTTGSTGSADDSSTEKYISYSNSRLAAAAKQLSGSQWQIEYTDGYNTATSARLGNKRYVKRSESTTSISVQGETKENYTLTFVYDGEAYYVSELTSQENGKSVWNLKKSDGIAIKTSDDSIGRYYIEKLQENNDAPMIASTYSLYDSTDVLLMYIPSESSNVLSIKSGKATYGGKEYYTETAVVQVETNAFVEIIYAFDGNTLKHVIVPDRGVISISSYSSTANTGLFQLPSKIMTEQEYCDTYMPVSGETEAN